MEVIDNEMRVAKISDIFEQIQTLNDLLQIHYKNDGDKSSIRQYEAMKNNFVNELLMPLKLGIINISKKAA